MTILRKAYLSKLAYEPKRAVIGQALHKVFSVGNVEFVFVPKTDTEGFAYRQGNKVIMAYAGTNSLRDLWRDVSVLPMQRYYAGWLHRGFAEIQDQIEPRVVEVFDSLNSDGKVDQVEINGHSLGATTAMIAADILYEYTAQEIPRRVTTFGCPNGWSKKARIDFMSRHDSVVNYINPGDYVTWLIGILSGRPGKDQKLSGQWGHMMDKYIENIWCRNERQLLQKTCRTARRA